MSKTESGLFTALENVLKHANRPMDCTEAWEYPEVREHAATVLRVSDYLGHMWRKGLLSRVPGASAEGSNARWSYQWKGKRFSPPLPTDAAATADTRKMLLQRPNMEITESGKLVTIELPNLIITIKAK